MPALAKKSAEPKTHPGLTLFFSKFKPVPPEWFDGKQVGSGLAVHSENTHLECTSYTDLVENYWRDNRDEPGGKRGAAHWSDAIDIVFSTMLAVVGSTNLQGSQIWLRVIGPPGSVKTTLCEALSYNRTYTYAMGLQTGFHSGMGQQNSLVDKISGKTGIINEGDMLLNSPNLAQTLAEWRDLYSGIARAHFKNGQSYEIAGLRTTMILAGTPILRRLNRSSAGDRFLDAVVYEKQDRSGPDKGELELLKKVALMALARCGMEATKDGGSQRDPHTEIAYQRTAGFIDYIRQTLPQKAGPMVKEVMERVANGDKVPKYVMDCISLAQLTAYLRARPDKEAEGKENESELPTRLTEQFIRLAVCLSLVLDRPIDSEVMRRVAIIARDTGRGRPLTMVDALATHGAMDNRSLSLRTDHREDTVRGLTNLLRSLGVIRTDTAPAANGALGIRRHLFRLSPQVTGLYTKMKTLIGNPR